jgi:glycosyltransferase involved in cell wall biosynthesis
MTTPPGAPARPPRLTVGLPVYNGERFLAASVEALLAQTFTDFELIISDNASTDRTREIAERYAAADPRVVYVRQPGNRGSAYNHNDVIRRARGELFKWASHDDLYHPQLLERCVELLDERPDVVVAHAWTAFVDEGGEIITTVPYPLSTDDPRPDVRFRSLLRVQGGDDIYGVIRTSVLALVPPLGSHHLADRTFVTELALHGRFANVPQYLYFRRDHPERAERASPSIRSRCVQLDPRRADRLRHPVLRLLVEYVLAYLAAVRRAPIDPAARRRCRRELVRWVARHADPLRRRELLNSPDPAVRALGARSWAGRVSGRAGRQHPPVAAARRGDRS